jgi:hypothetical protein
MSEQIERQLELTMEEAKEMVARNRAFENLCAHPDFDLLIHQYYFKDEASRLVMLRAKY